jgi:hypothetical protein
VEQRKDKARPEESGMAAEDEGEMSNTPSFEGGAEAKSSFCASMDPMLKSDLERALESHRTQGNCRRRIKTKGKKSVLCRII